MRKLIIYLISFIVGLPVILVSVEFGGSFLIGYPPITIFVMHELPFMGKKFTSKRWFDAGSCRGLSDGECSTKQLSCPRGGMVRDLTKNYLVKGKTSRFQVSQLLGKVDGVFRFNNQQCYRYFVGMCSGLRIDYDSLYVCFDNQGLVSSSGHQQH